MAKEIKSEFLTAKASEREQLNYKHSAFSISYLDFFGFTQNPFPVVPDDKNFYVSKNIDQVMSEIIYGINDRKGFMVLTGEVGLGKTTITRRIIKILSEKSIETSLVFHTSYSDVELLKEINRDFGLLKNSRSGCEQLGDQMDLLNTFLLEQNAEGKNCAIIIDDAQNLDSRSLELVRMISNLETDTQKLVQILLVGQPELAEKLNLKELRQLKSRVIINKKVEPLKLKDMQDYLQFKLNMCGSFGRVTITKSALKHIFGYTRGNFRAVNILMDRCMCVAFLHSATEIDCDIVKRAGADLEVKRVLYNLKKTGLLLSLAALLVLAVGLIIYYPPQKHEAPIKKSFPAKVTTIKKQRPARLPVPAPKIPASVTDFLKSYTLMEYSGAFYEAIKRFDFSKLSEKILSEKGYQLVQLDRIDEEIRKKYGVLSCLSPDGKQKTFVLFWKPEITVDRFYYGYQGEDISLLQQELKRIGLYSYAVDGSVGRNLMKAVVQFQKQSGLLLTGYPDEAFIFLLMNQGRENEVPGLIKVLPEQKPEQKEPDRADTDNSVRIDQESIGQ